MTTIIEKLRPLILPVVIATLFAFVGWLGMPDRAPSYFNAWPGFVILEVMFALPGLTFAAVIAMVSSPQGIHGMDQFIWVIFPVNWVTYFILTTVVRSQRGQKTRETADKTGETGDVPYKTTN